MYLSVYTSSGRYPASARLACAKEAVMKVRLLERPVPPGRDAEILDILGFVAPSFLLSMLQATSDCVKILSVEGRILFANQIALDDLMGGALDQVRDTIWCRYWPLETRPALEEALDLTIQGRHIYCELPRPTEDGQDRLWAVNLTPVFDGTGEVIAVVVLSHDLTANRNAAPFGH
jgi:PAS domain S-box-containing protein